MSGVPVLETGLGMRPERHSGESRNSALSPRREAGLDPGFRRGDDEYFGAQQHACDACRTSS